MNEITMVRQDLESADSSPVRRVRGPERFPILSRTVYGKPLVYLDSAASAQKPRQVIDAMVTCMTEEYSNVHRGLHWLSATATTRFEAARKTVQRFINAREDREIIFTRSATEAINLVARAGAGPTAGRRRNHLSTWNITPISCRGRCCGPRRASLLEGRADRRRAARF